MLYVFDGIETRKQPACRYNGGRIPTSLVFYRDGVSEGEMTKVLNSEYKAIKEVSF